MSYLAHSCASLSKRESSCPYSALCISCAWCSMLIKSATPRRPCGSAASSSALAQMMMPQPTPPHSACVDHQLLEKGTGHTEAWRDVLNSCVPCEHHGECASLQARHVVHAERYRLDCASRPTLRSLARPAMSSRTAEGSSRRGEDAAVAAAAAAGTSMCSSLFASLLSTQVLNYSPE